MSFDLESDFFQQQKEDTRLLEFDYHPLVYIACMRLEGYHPPEIYEVLSHNERTNKDRLLEMPLSNKFEEAKTTAKSVMRYFDKKVTMRILKDVPLSSFLQKAAKITNQENNVQVNHLAVAVMLVDLYHENVASDAIHADVKDFDIYTPSHEYVSHTLKFQGKVKTSIKERKGVIYYWKDEKGRLVIKHVKDGSQDGAAWHLIAKQPEIKVNGVVRVHKATGQDCVVADLCGTGYELEF